MHSRGFCETAWLVEEHWAGEFSEHRVFVRTCPWLTAPLLLHLFDRRRNAVIQWGAMQFLMEAAAKKTSARRSESSGCCC